MKPVPDLLQRVAAAIERHGMFAPAQRVGVAVSGGADSVCLLHVLHQLAARFELCLAVLHLDHGLRGEESRADAEFVRKLALSLGLPFTLRRAGLPPGNLEQAGRQARLDFFRGLISAGALERVALGHTRRDQAETVLVRFLRGSGTAGLAGIRPVTAEGIVRPLLEIGRPEIEAWLRGRGIPWREDSSNASPAFARNRIRHELLPQLARDWNPRIEETLAHTAAWAQAEESYWQGELERLAPAPILSVPTLRTLPAAVARRLVRAAIAAAKGDLRSIDFAHVESILDLARSPRGHGAVPIPGLEALRSFDRIRLAAPAPPAPYSFPIPRGLAGPLALAPPRGSPVLLELVEKPETSPLSVYVYNSEMGCLDWGRLSGSLVLRNWNPGDRFQPIGSAGPRKLKTFFQAARIPLWERAQWPVLADGFRVVWTRRFGVAAAVAAGDTSRLVLRVGEIGKPADPPSNSESGSGEPASNEL